jgi:hypothetical protein
MRQAEVGLICAEMSGELATAIDPPSSSRSQMYLQSIKGRELRSLRGARGKRAAKMKVR